MQSAETVLGVLRERGRRGLPCDELYRQLFNPQLYLLAYGRLYSNHGAMTPGATGESAEGMSLGKIGRVIDALRHERFRWTPVKRVYIPKKNGKRRPLGLPSWTDKLVAEVVRLLLEAYYEPRFSDASHGFRPGRGCHAALRTIAERWQGTTWFIEGDIADCFGTLDRTIMLSTLAEKITDRRFLGLLRTMLAAGYLEDWIWNATLSGVPQGGVASPILSNIYMHRLDEFVETVLIPEHTRGLRRKPNREYHRVYYAMRAAHARGDLAAARKARKRLRTTPGSDPYDPGYRRLRYIRYADDTLLGFAGPRHEAEQIKDRLARFLREELKLQLSQDKTLITHGRTQAARFLGYEITVQHSDTKITNRRRSVNGVIRLRVPKSVIASKCAPYLKRGKPAHRSALMNAPDRDIINTYGAEYRGIVQYYLLASDVYRLGKLHWVMETSLLKTLAGKHRSRVAKMAARYKATVDTPHGPHRCIQHTIERAGRKPLVTRFGGIPLRRDKRAFITERRTHPAAGRTKEIISRLLLGRCELCGANGHAQVHHVRSLADLDSPSQRGRPWVKAMVKKRRKTLVVCRDCHNTIHAAGRPNVTHKSPESCLR
jgi:group II intron reverse transcriptase/maturase